MGDRNKKILALDGKTQRGNENERQKVNRITSAVDDGGFFLGETLADGKSSEITAIPELLSQLNVQGAIVTADAIGCQTDIARPIRKRRTDYVLGLRGIRVLYMNFRHYLDILIAL
jgi:hypothetical protein